MSDSKPINLKKVRIDELLVSKGLAPDIKVAQSYVLGSHVVVNEQRVDHAGQLVKSDALVRLRNLPPYVSRGGEKLAGAMQDLKLENSIKHSVVLDIGSSTGGFTDYMLQAGAKQVFAVDVGTNQLAWKLRQDPRVEVFEQTDLRDFTAPASVVFDWVLADISFNNLARFTPDIKALPLADDAKLLLLVKPQFELPKHQVATGGVVQDESLRKQAVKQVEEAFQAAGFPKGVAVESRLKGTKGNQEIFYYINL